MFVIYRAMNGYIVRRENGCMFEKEIPTVYVFENLAGVAAFLCEKYGDNSPSMAANHKPRKRK